jgi:hypothetical protein
MTRKWVTIILCLPALGAALYWLLHHPDRSEARTIAVTTFGGFAVLIVVFTLALPSVMRRLDHVDRADEWRRAAIAGLPQALFFTFLWSFLFLPRLHATEQVLLGAAGVTSLCLALWWGRQIPRST